MMVNEALEVDGEEMGVVETYADYKPAKLKLGRKHPDPVVETASLSSVEPVDVTYTLSLPDATVREGLLSALQLESVVYASQAHQQVLPDGTRAGFLIGDGAGVGKGRTIAGIIFENYLKGRKRAIWVSVSNDLVKDAELDFLEIGAGEIKVHPLINMNNDYISSAANGNVTEGVVFCTYTTLIAQTKSSGCKFRMRLKQLLQWCGEDFDGCIVFDECHKAKNLRPIGLSKPTKTGLAVLELQKLLPKARVVYSSATAMSKPDDMAYMMRLGVWGEGTPFCNFKTFTLAMEKRGVAAMEVVALEMKLRGVYIARQLSYRGVSYEIMEVPIDPKTMEIYNMSVTLWVEAMQKFTKAANLIGASNRMKKTMWGVFWSAHQLFFKYLCIAAKVNHAIVTAREAVESGKCVVIGLQSTGEACTLKELDRVNGKLKDFVSPSKELFQSLVKNHFPTPDKNQDKAPDGAKDQMLAAAKDEAGGSNIECATERACRSMKKELLAAIEGLGAHLPINTLDLLINELGGPKVVAELTGRKGRVVQTKDGQIKYESRAEVGVPLSKINLEERRRFMNGKRDVAIISDATSSGISLQSDRRVRNQRKRVHITLELPWSADKAIQQFGRTHRSNQAIAPEYKFLVSQLAGERRFVSTVAKRLESLGALTHGDRHSTNTHDLSQFNIDNKYGRTALEIVMHAIVKSRTPLVPPPQDYAGDFFQDVARALLGVGLVVNRESKSGVLSLDKDYKNISKFLNRILGMPVEMQNRIFKYFTDTLAAVIRQARDSGDFDHGILDLGTSGHNVSRVKLERFMCHNATGVAPIELHTVHVERGIEWSEAMEMFSLLSGSKEGFYLSHQVRNGKHKVLLAVALDTPPSKEGKKLSKKDRMYQIYMPDTGKSCSPESLRDLRKNFKRVEAAEARSCWQQQLTASLQRCNHSYWGDKCRSLSKKGSDCEVGLRRRTYHVLSGSVLAVWPLVERVLSASTSLRKMQLVILKLTDGVKIVGIIIPNATKDHLAMAMDKT